MLLPVPSGATVSVQGRKALPYTSPNRSSWSCIASTSFSVAIPGAGRQRTRLGLMPPRYSSKSARDSIFAVGVAAAVISHPSSCRRPATPQRPPSQRLSMLAFVHHDLPVDNDILDADGELLGLDPRR